MRKDMQRVIITPGRSGGVNHNPKRSRDMDEWPNKEAMKPKHWDYKSLTDHLSPLYRFLDKQVGKKWDGIWKEICEHNDARSVIGAHLRGHVWDHVDKHDRRELEGWRFRHTWMYHYLYLDADRILRMYPRTKYVHQAPVPEYFESDGCLLKSEKGIWYFYESYTVEYEDVDKLQMALRRTTEPIYITRTRKNYKKIKQLNKRDLREHGVKNG